MHRQHSCTSSNDVIMQLWRHWRQPRLERHLSRLLVFTYANTAGEAFSTGLELEARKFHMQGTSLHCPRGGPRADKAFGQLCRLATDCSNEQLLDGPGDRQPINVTLSAFKCEDWTESALIPPTHLPKRRTTPVSSPKCQFIKSNWHVTNNWQRWADEIETDSWMDTA